MEVSLQDKTRNVDGVNHLHVYIYIKKKNSDDLTKETNLRNPQKENITCLQIC